MKCPKCGSENVNVQLIQATGKTKNTETDLAVM